MSDSLTRRPLPPYKIPITITFDGQERAGYLQPVDDYEPCRSYMVYIEDRWKGMLHCFKVGWQTDTEALKPFVEELSEMVMLWHG